MATVDTTMFPYTQPETSSTAGQTDFLDQEVFMTLLLEQLKNQDPMDPMETNDMTAQLAALAQVEELQSVNANLETLHTYQSALSNEQSVALIGKTVKAVGTTLNLGRKRNRTGELLPGRRSRDGHGDHFRRGRLDRPNSHGK